MPIFNFDYPLRRIGRVYLIDGETPRSELILSSPKTANSFLFKI